MNNYFDWKYEQVQKVIENHIKEGGSGMVINTENCSFENEREIKTWVTEMGYTAILNKDCIKIRFTKEEKYNY